MTNIGAFDVPIRAIQDTPELIGELMSFIQFIPMHVKASFDSQSVRYWGLSPVFAPWNDPYTVPLYSLMFEANDEGETAVRVLPSGMGTVINRPFADSYVGMEPSISQDVVREHPDKPCEEPNEDLDPQESETHAYPGVSPDESVDSFVEHNAQQDKRASDTPKKPIKKRMH